MQGLRADALNQNWSNKILMAWQRDKSEKYPEQYSWLEYEAKASNWREWMKNWVLLIYRFFIFDSPMLKMAWFSQFFPNEFIFWIIAKSLFEYQIVNFYENLT